MHVKRWLTGIVAIPILIFVVGPGPRVLFYVLLCIISLAGLIEFHRMAGSNLPTFIRCATYFLTLLLFALFYTRQILFMPVIVLLWAFVPMTFYMLTRPSPSQRRTSDISRALLGPIYVALPLAMLMMIDLRPQGKFWIFFLLVVVFANDTGAFYFGRLFGKHKLYEAISPAKTWEGAVGGLLCSIIAALWFYKIFLPQQTHLTILALVFLLCLTAQLGDLAQSMIKRDHGVKDTGKILPGHGGILDRIDGLLFSTLVLYIFLNWSIG